MFIVLIFYCFVTLKKTTVAFWTRTRPFKIYNVIVSFPEDFLLISQRGTQNWLMKTQRLNFYSTPVLDYKLRPEPRLLTHNSSVHGIHHMGPFQNKQSFWHSYSFHNSKIDRETIQFLSEFQDIRCNTWWPDNLSKSGQEYMWLWTRSTVVQEWSKVHFSDWFPMILHTKNCF